MVLMLLFIYRLLAIDFVQEHILGQGQQKNESWVEQKKDDRIESAIRHGLHLSDKDEKDKKDKH